MAHDIKSFGVGWVPFCTKRKTASTFKGLEIGPSELCIVISWLSAMHAWEVGYYVYFLSSTSVGNCRTIVLRNQAETHKLESFCWSPASLDGLGHPTLKCWTRKPIPLLSVATYEGHNHSISDGVNPKLHGEGNLLSLSNRCACWIGTRRLPMLVEGRGKASKVQSAMFYAG